MAYDLIKISALPETTPDESQDIVIGDGDYAKRINYGDVKNDMVGTSPSYTTDTEPYLMRRTAHVGVVGKCALNKLVGGSLGWNQLVPKTANTNISGGITFTNNGDGSWTLTGTGTSNNAFINLNYVNSTTNCFLPNHVYFITPNKSGSTTLTSIGLYVYGLKSVNSPIDAYTAKISKADSTVTAGGWVRLQVTNGNEINIGTVKLVPQVIDLTVEFGSTIANYIYSLESATAGAGVAWLSRYINLGTYHAYDLGSTQSVQATAHVTTGFNQWDEAWELGGLTEAGALYPNTDRIRSKNYIPILPNTAYYYSYKGNESPTFGVCYYDGNKNFIGSRITFTKNNIRTSLANARYMKFYVYNSSPNITTYANNICINISKPSGSPKNGDYVPYNGHSYPLGSDTLRGYPMLVNNKLGFDGDIKTPDGKIRRRYGILDLGSLTWVYSSANARFYTDPDPTGVKPSGSSNIAANMICGRYQTVSWDEINSTAQPNKVIAVRADNSRLSIRDSQYGSDAASFKASLSGVYLVYPLTTETTESSTAFQKIQTIDADGTESFTTSSPVPVGHETQYPDNVLAALEWLGE